MHPNITDVAELRRVGASRREIQERIRPLTRLCVGSYSPTPANEEDEHLLRAMALIDRLEGVAASHTTAALAHGLPLRKDHLGTVQLSPVIGRRGNPKRGVAHHVHARRLDPASLVTVSDLPATNALTTVLDCARLLDADWGVVIADAALNLGLVTREALIPASLCVMGLRGAARARALAGRVSEKAESPGESLARLHLLRMGFPLKEQVELTDVPGCPRVDLLIDGWLVVEFDGRAKYEKSGDVARAHWEEKQRHDRVVEAGYEVIRITWADLADEARLRQRVERALRRARLRRGHSA